MNLTGAAVRRCRLQPGRSATGSKLVRPSVATGAGGGGGGRACMPNTHARVQQYPKSRLVQDPQIVRIIKLEHIELE